jgi:hypothetical protein
VYLFPFIVAETRRASNVGTVFGVNLLFGWSVVGWIVALVVALRSDPPPAQISAWTISDHRPGGGSTLGLLADR